MEVGRSEVRSDAWIFELVNSCGEAFGDRFGEGGAVGGRSQQVLRGWRELFDKKISTVVETVMLLDSKIDKILSSACRRTGRRGQSKRSRHLSRRSEKAEQTKKVSRKRCDSSSEDGRPMTSLLRNNRD
jgi:hypothetical protein